MRSFDHDGKTNYCAGGCLSDDRMDAFYFTPVAPEIDLAAQERARTVISKEIETEAIKEGQQIALLDKGEKWQEHWRGMPEFVQEDLQPYKSLIVHFESREDMEDFAKFINQQIGLNTPFIWYPEMTIERYHTKKYISK